MHVNTNTRTHTFFFSLSLSTDIDIDIDQDIYIQYVRVYIYIYASRLPYKKMDQTKSWIVSMQEWQSEVSQHSQGISSSSINQTGMLLRSN
jgi:type II restriction/modification system DNA methylase subunit YeeA